MTMMAMTEKAMTEIETPAAAGNSKRNHVIINLFHSGKIDWNKE